MVEIHHENSYFITNIFHCHKLYSLFAIIIICCKRHKTVFQNPRLFIVVKMISLLIQIYTIQYSSSFYYVTIRILLLGKVYYMKIDLVKNRQ